MLIPMFLNIVLESFCLLITSWPLTISIFALFIKQLKMYSVHMSPHFAFIIIGFVTYESCPPPHICMCIHLYEFHYCVQPLPNCYQSTSHSSTYLVALRYLVKYWQILEWLLSLEKMVAKI